jgi:hypothetical protein
MTSPAFMSTSSRWRPSELGLFPERTTVGSALLKHQRNACESASCGSIRSSEQNEGGRAPWLDQARSPALLRGSSQGLAAPAARGEHDNGHPQAQACGSARSCPPAARNRPARGNSTAGGPERV